MVTKDKILAAIRREAAANSGVPVGRDKFFAATGIKESAWRGQYWARWGDALIEAGFEPNTWAVQGHDDGALVRKLAELAQKLGHYPTSAERSMHRRQDSSFPSSNTFDDRLGGREAQLTLLLDFALANDEFSEVYDMVRPLMESAEARPTPEQAALGVRGSVYLMKSGKHYKIGFSSHVGRRSYEVALQLPEKLEVVHEFETDDPEGIERYWHERFAEKRTHGEWFLLTDADVAAFKRRRSFM